MTEPKQQEALEPMTVWISLTHPVSYGGGGPWVEALASLMEEKLRGFGSAVSALEVEVSFATKLPPLRTFEDMWPRYHKSLEKLPTARLLRRKRAFKLHLRADFGTVEETWGPGEGETIPPIFSGQPGLLRKVHQLKQEYLEALAKLIVSNLCMLKRRLKKADKFDYPGFIAASASILSSVPSSKSEADGLVVRRERRLESLRRADPWHSVDVDWDDFHPEAKKLLNDPWFWSCIDPWAPHGNDTGADILVSMMKQPQSAWTFVKESMDTLTRNGVDWMANESGLALEIAKADDQMYTVCEQTLLAVAFAEIKLSGNCSHHFLQMALNALQRLSGREMMQWWSGHLSPELQRDWKRRHDQMTLKLQEIAVKRGMTN